CAARFGVTPFVRFGHELILASWDDAARKWRIRTTRGAFTADVLVSAVGALSDPAYPRIPRPDAFPGKAVHSARWGHGHDLAGQRVAVLGTGASAIQFVPKIQPVVGRLLVFQRTPPWVLPRRDHAIGPGARRIFGASPLATLAVRSCIYALREATALAFLYQGLGRSLQRYAERVARLPLERAIQDPTLRAKLRPRYALGCKRILLSDDCLPAIAQWNVEVVTDAIREIRAHGIVTVDGAEREVDTIVFGTGFQVQELPVAKRVRGRAGRTLAETW